MAHVGGSSYRSVGGRKLSGVVVDMNAPERTTIFSSGLFFISLKKMEGKMVLTKNKKGKKLKAMSYFPGGCSFLLGLRECREWGICLNSQGLLRTPFEGRVGETAAEGSSDLLPRAKSQWKTHPSQHRK